MPIDEQLGVFSNYKPRIRAAWIGPCSWDVADVPTSAATVLPRVVVDLSLIRRINWKGSAGIAVPNAAGNRAPRADLLITRRKAARTQHRVHVTRLLWLLLRGASGRVNMLTRRLGPRDLVFATASAVSLETVSSAIRQASLLNSAVENGQPSPSRPLNSSSSPAASHPLRSTRWRFVQKAISTSSSQVGMGEAA